MWELTNEEFTGLMQQYQKLIYTVCLQFVHEPHTAEDLTQETFLSVYRHLKEFDGQHEKAWICRIASNKSIDYLKAAGRRAVPTEDVGNDCREADSTQAEKGLTENTGPENPEQKVLEKETRETLLERCRSLKPPYDEVAALYFYEERKPEEIAAKTGRNIKTIRTQIYRARSQLRELYRRQWETYSRKESG